ncbi:MAG TPA: preprotein translocase subunit SecG [Steroidobacteraceae bacterium]|nr:preprotein translocase subunit SecG [Steroidobacteraceae bacterium]
MALTFLQFFCALVIIALVLIQRGKGAEAGAGFGAGASGTVFGARGAGTALSRATAIFAALFMLNSLALGYVGSHQPVQPKTLLDIAGGTPTAPARSAAPLIPTPAGAPRPGSGSAPNGNGASGNGPSAGAAARSPAAAPPPSAPGTAPASQPK